MDRLINRRQQGDLGEASAIEWLTSKGATVMLPLGHSPDYDLIADAGGELLRVQVKTSVHRADTLNGDERYAVQLATLGGNQSWGGQVKRLDPTRIDSLFVLVGDGRRWFVPARELGARTAVTLGGPKYSEYEIERGTPIIDLVYGPRGPLLQSTEPRGSADVGESGEPVKFVPRAEWVRIPPPPSTPPSVNPEAIARTRVSSNHQVTIPVGPFRSANLQVGDLIRVEGVGDGRLVLERVRSPDAQQTLPVAE